MGKYERLAKDIVNNVGGKENIISVIHCVTRLRFQLKDESKANTSVLKNMDGVVTVMKGSGQYQVVIGNHVPEVFSDVCQVANIKIDNNAETKGNKQSLKDGFLDFISAALAPCAAVLCASGMIKGILALCTTFGLIATDAGFYILMSSIANAAFFFIPVLVSYNVAKKLGMNLMLGMVIGLALCYPAINGAELNIFGFTYNVTYTSTLLPAIFTVIFAARVEKLFNKILPDVVKNFLTPMLVLTIVVPIGYMLIGPIANVLAKAISSGLISVYSVNPILSALVVGALYQVMIVFGVHGVFVMTAYMNVLAGVPDPHYAALGVASFAQTGVVLAIFLRTRNAKLKTIAFPAFISGIFGVTEPAIYGITLPRIKYFIVSCIASGIAAMGGAILGLKIYTIPGMGIFKLPGYIDPANPSKSFVYALIIMAVAVVIGFIVTFVLYKDSDYGDDQQVTDKVANKLELKKESLITPIKGNVIPLSEVKDEAFSNGILGNGVAIEPNEGKVYAPFDGTILSLFPTKHAVGIISDNGCEVLIHIGIDTVKLNGKYFTTHVEQGENVKKGDLLISFDIIKIKQEGYSVQTPIIITNTNDYLDVIAVNNKSVAYNDNILTVIV